MGTAKLRVLTPTPPPPFPSASRLTYLMLSEPVREVSSVPKALFLSHPHTTTALVTCIIGQ